MHGNVFTKLLPLFWMEWLPLHLSVCDCSHVSVLLMYFQKPSVNRLIKFFDTASIQSISESMMNHETHLLTNKTLYSVPINPTVPLLFQLPVMQHYSETEFIVGRSQYQSTSPAAFQQVHLAIFSKQIQIYWFQVYIHLAINSFMLPTLTILCAMLFPIPISFLEMETFLNLNIAYSFPCMTSRPTLSTEKK